jgi:hypothetical protein
MTFRHFLPLGLAIAAAVSAPLAFAQDANASATAQDAAQSATPATPATPADPQAGTQATPATPATPAQPATDAKKVTWSDLDADKDGKLTKTEAAPIDSLSQSFDAADADKDGALTTDEYKAYLAMHGKGGAGSGS